MSNKPKMIDSSRRGFLRKSAVAGGAAAAGATLIGTEVQASPEPVSSKKSAKGYTESDHVKAYYQRERFY